jgi:hypothetical protein
MTDVRGKGNYLLSSTMTQLNYLTDAPFECDPKDRNVAAFAKAASTIGGRNAVEEFLACGMWPLSKKFGFEVEMKETPLLKVVAPMLKVTPTIGAQELEADFEKWIVNAASLLVGNYNTTEHNTYKGLRYGRLNRVFELADVLCQPRPELNICTARK